MESLTLLLLIGPGRPGSHSALHVHLIDRVGGVGGGCSRRGRNQPVTLQNHPGGGRDGRRGRERTRERTREGASESERASQHPIRLQDHYSLFIHGMKMKSESEPYFKASGLFFTLPALASSMALSMSAWIRFAFSGERTR